MLRLADRELPDWLQAELARLIADLPVNAVLSLAKAEPAIGRGFRLKPASAPILRQRLQSLLDGNADCTPAIIDTLRDHGLCAQVLRVLSEETLQLQFKWLTGYFGRERWVLATLLDRRSKVRQLAEPWLDNAATDQSENSDSLPDRETSRRKLANNLSPFFTQLGELLENAPASAGTTNTSSSADTARLQSLEVQLRKQTRQQDKLREQLSIAQAAGDAEKNSSATLRARLNEERDAHERTRSELEMLERSFSERLATELDAATGKLSRYWLQAPAATQQASDNADHTIVEKIDAALVRQTERDRHYGNRNEIRREIDSLRTALQRLDEAMLNAVNPHRELLPLREQAQLRLLQLRKLLDPQPAPANDTLTRLEVAMRTAQSPESLEQLSELVARLQQVSAIDAEQAMRIRTARTTRMELIFEQSEPDNHTLLPADIRARREIAASSHALVLIDGHNCLLAVDAIARRFQDQRQAAGATGRRWLAQACGTIFDSTLNARVTLYFDGDERHEESVTGNVIVVYSGGTGDQRADNEIIKQLQYLAADDTHHQSFLISNDHALRQQASALGAHIIDAEVLADWCNLYL